MTDAERELLCLVARVLGPTLDPTLPVSVTVKDGRVLLDLAALVERFASFGQMEALR